MSNIRFESEMAHELYIEVSAIADTSKIRRKYISNNYIWKLWQKVYKSRCGCTRYYLLPATED
ncbi:MAG: hypothetical protein K6G84_15090 [Lachnospiraceae bacterium]|nr:hypothetical protein [Lachnospiraceae bacterium]